MRTDAITTLRHQWETIELPSPLLGAMHDCGGPEGAWFSLSLEAPDGLRSWLHFRDTDAGLECAHGDDALPDSALQWTAVPDGPAVRAVMEEFVLKFAECSAARVECASPPCSFPDGY